MYMNGHNDLDCHTSGYFTGLISNTGYDSKNFRRVSVEHLLVVKGKIKRIIFIYDFDIQEGE